MGWLRLLLFAVWCSFLLVVCGVLIVAVCCLLLFAVWYYLSCARNLMRVTGGCLSVAGGVCWRLLVLLFAVWCVMFDHGSMLYAAC